MDYITLSNGVKMPQVGYGVFQVDPAECERCVSDALSAGYRHIDTAQAYFNEEGVGAALAKSNIARDELFITTKVWITNAGEKKAAASIDESLTKLGLDYLDLLLIHQPFSDYYGSWHAMEKALASGKVRAIGVSNFYPDRLADLCEFADVTPMVNQVETHVFFQQQDARKTMDHYGVAHESWGPLAEGKYGIFDNPVLSAIAAKYNKTVAQVALRYLLQRGVTIIPKSTHLERMQENIDLFDFALDATDMDAILALDTKKSEIIDHYSPATVEYLANYGK